MKNFILRRHISYTERAIVSAESWNEAKLMLNDDATHFELSDRGYVHDEKIEFIGES
jgi:hypothetical protein